MQLRSLISNFSHPIFSILFNCKPHEGHQRPQASSLLYLHLLLISSHFSSLNMPSTPYDSQIDQWPGPPSWTWLEYIPLLTRPSCGHLIAVSSVSHPKLWSSLKTWCSCQLPHVGKWHFHPMVSSAKDLRVILDTSRLPCCSFNPSANPIHYSTFQHVRIDHFSTSSPVAVSLIRGQGRRGCGVTGYFQGHRIMSLLCCTLSNSSQFCSEWSQSPLTLTHRLLYFWLLSLLLFPADLLCCSPSGFPPFITHTGAIPSLGTSTCSLCPQMLFPPSSRSVLKKHHLFEVFLTVLKL